MQFSPLVPKVGVAPRIVRQSELLRYHAGAGERKHGCLRFSARSTPIRFSGLDNKPFQFSYVGAEGGSRTHMKLPSRDFESRASAIPPLRHFFMLHIFYHNFLPLTSVLVIFLQIFV